MFTRGYLPSLLGVFPTVALDQQLSPVWAQKLQRQQILDWKNMCFKKSHGNHMNLWDFNGIWLFFCLNHCFKKHNNGICGTWSLTLPLSVSVPVQPISSPKKILFVAWGDYPSHSSKHPRISKQQSSYFVPWLSNVWFIWKLIKSISIW